MSEGEFVLLNWLDANADRLVREDGIWRLYRGDEVLGEGKHTSVAVIMARHPEWRAQSVEFNVKAERRTEAQP